MNQQVLYFIQSDYNNTANVLNTFANIYSAQDAVVLMGEAVLHAEITLKTVSKVYILEADAVNLTTQNSQIEVISYAQFAELCLQFKRSVRLK